MVVAFTAANVPARPQASRVGHEQHNNVPALPLAHVRRPVGHEQHNVLPAALAHLVLAHFASIPTRWPRTAQQPAVGLAYFETELALAPKHSG